MSKVSEATVVEEKRFTYEPTPSLFDGIKNNKSGGTLFQRFKQEHEYRKKGIGSNTFNTNANMKPDQISRCVPNKPGIRNDRIVADYKLKWEAGELNPETFFSDNSNKYLNKILKRYFDSRLYTQEREAAQLDVSNYFNRLTRDVLWNGKDYLEKDNLLYYGTEIVPGHFVKNDYEKNADKTLKEVAWVVAHNYVVPNLLLEMDQYNMIPKAHFKEWNEYISTMDDLDPFVKRWFTLDENGNCPFKTAVDSKNCNDFPGEPGGAEIVPFDEAKVIDAEFKVVDEHSDPLYIQYRDKMDLETAKEEAAKRREKEKVAEAIKPTPVLNPADAAVTKKEQEKHTFGQLKKNIEKAEEVGSKKFQAMTR